MQMKSLLELSKCRIREFMREPSAMFWVIFMPVLWMVVLGYSLSGQREPVYLVGVINTAQNLKQPETLQALANISQIKITSGSRIDLMPKLSRGDLQLLIDFESNPQKPMYVYDATNQDSRVAQIIVNDLWQRSLGRQDILASGEDVLEIKGSRYVDFLIPGLLGMSVLSTSFFGIGMTLVSNRRENLFKRYRTTPMRFSTFITSHIIGRCFGLCLETIAILIAGYLLFSFSFQGSTALLVATLVLGAAATTAIAALIASRTKSVPAVSGMLNLTMLPMIVLSGTFFPKKYFPSWLQQGAEWLPLSMINEALRLVAEPQVSMSLMIFPLVGLLSYAILGSLLTWKLFRWE